jgi:hypothetical protein
MWKPLTCDASSELDVPESLPDPAQRSKQRREPAMAPAWAMTLRQIQVRIQINQVLLFL